MSTGLKIYFYKCSIVEDAFYTVVFLFDVLLPCSVGDLSSFILNIKKLYDLRNYVKENCKKNNSKAVNVTSWKRGTFSSPLFNEIIETNVHNIPTRKRSRAYYD